MTNEPRERPTSFLKRQEYLGSDKSGLHANFCYIYPVGSKWAYEAWFAPIIAYEGVVLWEGEPQEDANSARAEAKKYLTFKLKELLNPLSPATGAKPFEDQPQLF
jgi:hypothetical protein